MIRTILRLCTGVMAFAPLAASAHVVAGSTHGFLHGFSHPLGGIDHVLAMVAVGVFAAHLGGRALWLVPLAFVSVMALGGIAGMAGVALPFVQIGIGLSVVVLGLAVAFRLSIATLSAMSLVGLFAVFHGHAHGTEFHEEAGPALTYALGFVCATALLHTLGVALGIATGNPERICGWRIIQVGGAAMAAAGVALLVLS